MLSRLHSRTALLSALLALFFGATFCRAQGIVTGSISGTVQDPQGAVVAHAKIIAKHLATNRQFAGESTAEGLLSLRGLPPGTYNLEVQSAGLRSFASHGVVVNAGEDTTLGVIQMEIGASTETVTVESTPPLVEASTQQISTSFDGLKTASLPIGNTFDSLTLFVPGISTAGDAAFSNNNGAEFAVNGQRARSNNFQIDGQSNNDNSVGGPAIFFGNQDAISEIQVVTNFDAQYGRNMGSVVNYVTRAGTNQFHGTAYEFWQGDHFDSLENTEKSPLFFGPQGLPFCAPGQSSSGGSCENPVVPLYVDNRFGGTIGGPVIKDRVWFFGSANLDRTRTGGLPVSTSPSIVPTPTGVTQLAAAFPNSPVSALYSSIGPSAVTAGNPVYSNLQNVLVTNQIDPSTGSAFACTTAGVNGCVPIQFGVANRFIPSPANDSEITGRVDIKVTNKDNFFARYLFQKTDYDGLAYDGAEAAAAGDWINIPGKGQQIGLDWVRDISNTLVNQVRLSYSRSSSYFDEGGFTGCNHQHPLNCPTQIAMFGSDPQDTASFGVGEGFPSGRVINVYQLQDNISLQRGRHTIRLGGETSQQRSPNVNMAGYNGEFIFDTFNDLVANNPALTLLTAGNPNLPFKETDLSFYGQDDWRIKENLTLNLGVRWEFYQQAINLLHDRSLAEETGPNPFWDTTLPLSQTTVPRIPQDLNNFGPVVGFAWTPRIWKSLLGDDKTVVRGGFRIGYDPEFYNMFLNVADSAPTSYSSEFVGPLPSSGFTGANLQGFLAPFLPAGGDPGLANELTVSPNFHNPYTEQWSFGVQRAITGRIVAEVRYVGNHTVGNFQEINANPALGPLISAGFGNLIPASMTPCSDPTKPGFAQGYANCNYTNVTEYNNGAWSKYNGLQSELRIANWHGVTSTVSYTWSHTMDNASEIFGNVAGGTTLPWSQSPFDTDRGERADSGIDYPNVLGLTFIYQLPFAKTQQGVLGHILGGWQMNTTYRYTSGQPYTVVQQYPSNGSLCDPTATFGGGFDACRPILSNPSLPMTSVGQYCDGTAICTAPGGSVYPLGTLVSFTDPCFNAGCAVTPITGAHWIHNDPIAADVLGSPFLGVGRNTLRGQPLTPVNLSIFKTTRLRENVSLQFQATAFNLFNTQFLGVPDPDLDQVGSGPPGPIVFGSTAYNSNGGSTVAGNTVFDGISRRRLMFGAKVIF